MGKTSLRSGEAQMGKAKRETVSQPKGDVADENLGFPVTSRALLGPLEPLSLLVRRGKRREEEVLGK